jgi:hypothetical protein
MALLSVAYDLEYDAAHRSALDASLAELSSANRTQVQVPGTPAEASSRESRLS